MVALIVNTSGAPVSLKHGARLSSCLVHGTQVTSEPADFPSSFVSSISSPGNDLIKPQPSLEPLLKVAYYLERKPVLLDNLESHRSAVALPGEHLGVTQCTQHHIKLKESKPVYVNACRLPHSQGESVQQLVEYMLNQGLIQKSAPLGIHHFLVPKHDGTFQPVIDIRRVNEVTVDNHYLSPVLRDFLMCLGRGNRVFSSLDLVSGYWQVPVAKASRELTDFSTPTGPFEWERMPFGLKVAPLTFQRTVNHIFGDMIDHSVYIYLDDIIITSKEGNSHLETLRQVLQRLKEVGLNPPRGSRMPSSTNCFALSLDIMFW